MLSKVRSKKYINISRHFVKSSHFNVKLTLFRESIRWLIMNYVKSSKLSRQNINYNVTIACLWSPHFSKTYLSFHETITLFRATILSSCFSRVFFLPATAAKHFCSSPNLFTEKYKKQFCEPELPSRKLNMFLGLYHPQSWAQFSCGLTNGLQIQPEEFK